MNVLEAKTQFDHDPTKIAVMTLAGKTVTRQALSSLGRAANFMQGDNQVVSLSTCMTVLLKENIMMMATLDRDATRDLLASISEALVADQVTAEMHACQLDAQLRLARAEVRLDAETSAAGRA